jgi:hypothetical protein
MTIMISFSFLDGQDVAIPYTIYRLVSSMVLFLEEFSYQNWTVFAQSLIKLLDEL